MDRAGGARHQVESDFQVIFHLLAAVQAACHCRQGLQERGDGLAVGRLPHLAHGIHDGRHRRFAERCGDRRPAFHENQDRLDAQPHLAEEAGAFQVIVEAFSGQDGQGFGHTALEHLRNLREAAIELRPVGFHQGMLVFAGFFDHRGFLTTK